MKIIFLVDSFPSISETFILNQITGLIDLGHDVFIFSASRPEGSDFHEDIRKYDLWKKTYYHNDRPSNKLKRMVWALLMIIFYGYKNPKAVINSLNFFKYGKEALSLTYLYKVMLFLGIGEADILLCHYGPNGNFAVQMKELGIKGKIVTMFHGYDIRRGIEYGGGIYKPLFEKGDRLLSISSYNYKHLVEFGAPVDKICDHPVGIDVDRYQFLPKESSSHATIKILTVSRLVKEKGIAYGLQAIHDLIYKRGISHIEYYILGDGPLRQELEDLAQQLQLKGKVYFLGYQPQQGVVEMLHQTHLFFLPSIAEALPVSLMEAQAAGLPVVATQVGSAHQVVLDGKSGFLVPSMDTSAMTDKLAYLIQNPNQWAGMREAGHKHIQEHYDIKRLNRRLADLCQGLLTYK